MMKNEGNRRPPAQPWRAAGVLLALVAGLFLSGCNAGVIALAVLLALDGDDGGVGGPAPARPSGVVAVKVDAVQNVRSDPAQALIRFTLTSAVPGAADVRIEFSLENGALTPATVDPLGVGSTGDGGAIRGLEATPEGASHRLLWDALSDLGLESDDSLRSVTLRVTTKPLAGPGGCAADDATCDEIAFFAGNDPPSISDVTFDPLGGGDVRVSFRLEDPLTNDPTDVRVEYTTSSGPIEGSVLRPATTDPGTARLSTLPEGNPQSFVWRSAADVGRVERTIVQIRLTPRDRVDGVPGKAGEPAAGSFPLDSNDPPQVILPAQGFDLDPDERRGQALRFIVEDEESDPVDVVIQWAAPGAGFPDLPSNLDEDPGAREALLGDPAARRQYRIITLRPEIIAGRVEEPAPGLALDEASVLATWVRHEEELRGLRGRAPVSGGGAAPTPATMEGRDVELVTASEFQRRTVCDFDGAAGILRVDRPFQPPASPGDRLRIDLGGEVRLQSAPEGVAHLRTWRSDIDLPGGGPVELRVTAFDRAGDLGFPLAGPCAGAGFPSDNALRGARGGAAVSGSKTLRGSFGLRPPLVESLAPTEVATAVEVVDIDGDGRQDIVAATRTTPVVLLMLQTVPGLFDVLRFADARIGDLRALTVADLDGDGDLDIAVAGDDPEGDGAPIVLLLFQEPGLDFIPNRVVIQTGSLAQPAALVAADFDQNGETDLAVADADPAVSAATIFYRGAAPAAGCGSELDGYFLCAAGGPLAVEDLNVADMDADGRLDLVASVPEGLAVLYQEADGDFEQRSVSIPAPGARPRFLVIRNRDIVAGDLNEARIIVARQDSPSSFTVDIPQGAASFASAVDLALADLDRNGRRDLVVAERASGQEDAGVAVCFADSSGEMSCSFLRRPPAGGGPAPVPAAVAVADIDGDGRPDVVSADDGSPGIAVYLQDRPGGFSSPAEVLADEPAVDRPRALAAGDFDGDGRLDVAVLSLVRGDITLILERDAGPAELRPISFPEGVDARGPLAIAAGDIDGDGRADLATANVDSNNVALFLQNGAGAFTSRVSTLSSDGLIGPETLALADLDGDGRLDVATAGRISGDVVWFSQRGDGSFGPAQPLEVPAGMQLEGPLSLSASDVDGDGRADVTVAGHRSGNLLVFYQQSTRGSFDPAIELALPPGARPVEVVVEDLDEDGRRDLAAASLGDPPVAVLLQTQPRSFSMAPLPAPPPAAEATALAAADFSGDGRMDLAWADANQVDPAIHVLLRSGGAGYATLRSAAVGAPTGLLAVDLDGDGEADIVSANRVSGNVTVFPGGR